MFTWVSKPSPATRLSTATGLGKPCPIALRPPPGLRSNQVGARPTFRPSSISRAPECGQTPPLPTPSGPPSPTTTPNSSEWGKAGIVIANIVLDPRITRPILASFPPEPTPEEHRCGQSRAESRQSRSFPAVPGNALRSMHRRRPQSLCPHGLSSRQPTEQETTSGPAGKAALPSSDRGVPDSCQKYLTAPHRPPP